MAHDWRAVVDGSTDGGILDGDHTQGRVRLREDVLRGRGCAVQYSTRDDFSLLVCALVDVGSIYICEEGVGSEYR